MNYTIFMLPQVLERTITVPGAGDSYVTKPNIPKRVYPSGTSLHYEPATLDIYSADSAKRRVLLNDPTGTATSADIFAAFPEIREPKAMEIRAEGSRRLLALANPYSAEERETWITQQREAEAWLLDNSAPTPMLDAMATNRGITKAVLVGKIMENVGLFRTVAGSILGEQQRLLDLVYGTASFDSMQAVSWENHQ